MGKYVPGIYFWAHICYIPDLCIYTYMAFCTVAHLLTREGRRPICVMLLRTGFLDFLCTKYYYSTILYFEAVLLILTVVHAHPVPWYVEHRMVAGKDLNDLDGLHDLYVHDLYMICR